jgi:hypothetical protein
MFETVARTESGSHALLDGDSGAEGKVAVGRAGAGRAKNSENLNIWIKGLK